jgi:hypothetical protein
MIWEAMEIVVLVGVLLILYSERVNHSGSWSAAVTPLASIIGSGFLVSGPVLVSVFSQQAPIAMLLVVAAAYLLGEVIRFNICNAEPILNAESTNDLPIGIATALYRRLKSVETLADLSLGFAYVASVAFYIRLLAAFALKIFNIENDVLADLLASVLLLTIAGIGWFRNLKGLVFIEKHAVNGKLSIIACLLVALGVHYFSLDSGTAGVASDLVFAPVESLWNFENFRYLAGVLLIVQGFETSRYLGNHYPATTRIGSMRLAQILSAVIYCLFILWSWRLFVGMNGEANETEIISVVGSLSLLLPYLLAFAAILSQFSAAIADTLGAGGLQVQLSKAKISEQQGYVLVCTLAVVLIWATDIFSIITIASRIFAIYYLFQTLIALLTGYAIKRHVLHTVLQFAALVLLLFVIIFAKPLAA